MKLSEFSKATGLTKRQIRRLCQNDSIPYVTLPSGRKQFTDESVIVAGNIFFSRTRHFYLGPIESSAPDLSIPLLPLLSAESDTANSIYNKVIHLLERRLARKVTVNLNFHPLSVQVTARLSVYCINNNIEFHGGYNV